MGGELASVESEPAVNSAIDSQLTRLPALTGDRHRGFIRIECPTHAPLKCGPALEAVYGAVECNLRRIDDIFEFL